MSFSKMQEALRAEGWFVEWAMPCCQTCAWSEIPFEHESGPFKGKEVDFDKVLMNHEQDCEIDCMDECETCDGDGMIDNPDYDDDEDAEQYIECDDCFGEGCIRDDTLIQDAVWGHTMYVDNPVTQTSSYFCFSNSEKGIANLKAVLPIIEESGCEHNWNGTGDSRIDISWR